MEYPQVNKIEKLHFSEAIILVTAESDILSFPINEQLKYHSKQIVIIKFNSELRSFNRYNWIP